MSCGTRAVFFFSRSRHLLLSLSVRIGMLAAAYSCVWDPGVANAVNGFCGNLWGKHKTAHTSSTPRQPQLSISLIMIHARAPLRTVAHKVFASRFVSSIWSSRHLHAMMLWSIKIVCLCARVWSSSSHSPSTCAASVSDQTSGRRDNNTGYNAPWGPEYSRWRRLRLAGWSLS